MLVLLHEHVEEVATQSMAIDAMEAVFRFEGEGRIGKPQRIDVPTGNGWLRIMPVVADGLGVFGFKAMNLVPKVGVRYVVHIYDLSDGAILGIVDAQLLTTLRTAATAAVAARRLAKDDVKRAAVIGTGAEARTHLQAMQLVRPVETATVYSRSSLNRSNFIHDMRPLVDAELLECQSTEDALRGADLVILSTKSNSPVLFERHLEPGMHVSSVGSARLDQFEIDPAAFRGFDTIACDSVEHVSTEAGDAATAAEAGYWDPHQAWGLGDLVMRSRPERGERDLTLFKSVGTATQDIALAVELLEVAQAKGLGIEIQDFPHMKPLG